jgi:hypothetical protein
MNAEITASDPIDEMIGNDPVGKRSYGPPCTPQGSSPSSPTTHAADTAASEQTSSERHDGTRNDESFWSANAAHGARRSEVFMPVQHPRDAAVGSPCNEANARQEERNPCNCENEQLRPEPFVYMRI